MDIISHENDTARRDISSIVSHDIVRPHVSSVMPQKRNVRERNCDLPFNKEKKGLKGKCLATTITRWTIKIFP